jgi:diaminopimelate epimerase
MDFSKYHGTGNDFIMVDNRSEEIKLSQQQIEHLCHRRFGIGADGLILLEIGSERLKMVYYNSDGRQSSMCGNGGRCFARFAKDLGLVTDNGIEFDAIDGWHQADFKGDDVILQMKNCDGFSASDDGFVLDTGSPHFVKFVPSVFWNNDEFVGTARAIRNRPQFKEKGINVNYINEVEKGKLKIRTFERGVEDETYSCGTGVTAAALVYGYQNKLNEVNLESKGGNLSVSFQLNPDGIFTDVFLKGPAVKVFDGKVDV